MASSLPTVPSLPITSTFFPTELREPPLGPETTMSKSSIPEIKVNEPISGYALRHLDIDRSETLSPFQTVDKSAQTSLLSSSDYLNTLLEDSKNTRASTRLLCILKDENIALDTKLGIKLVNLAKDLCQDGPLMASKTVENPESEVWTEERYKLQHSLMSKIAKHVGITITEDDEKGNINTGIPANQRPQAETEHHMDPSKLDSELLELMDCSQELRQILIRFPTASGSDRLKLSDEFDRLCQELSRLSTRLTSRDKCLDVLFNHHKSLKCDIPGIVNAIDNHTREVAASSTIGKTTIGQHAHVGPTVDSAPKHAVKLPQSQDHTGHPSLRPALDKTGGSELPSLTTSAKPANTLLESGNKSIATPSPLFPLPAFKVTPTSKPSDNPPFDFIKSNPSVATSNDNRRESLQSFPTPSTIPSIFDYQTQPPKYWVRPTATGLTTLWPPYVPPLPSSSHAVESAPGSLFTPPINNSVLYPYPAPASGPSSNLFQPHRQAYPSCICLPYSAPSTKGSGGGIPGFPW